MDRWQLEKQITIKALKDPNFKKELLSHPKEAIKNHFKGNLPDNFQIKIHEEKKNEWTLCIPHLETEDKTFSDAELEKVFAGSGCWPISCGPGTR